MEIPNDSSEMDEQEYIDSLKKEVLSALATCINCRFCVPSCPLFDITSGELYHGASGITRSLYYALKWDVEDKDSLTELREILYSCMMCKSCEVTCKNSSTGTKLLDAIGKGREILLEKMVGPMPDQKKILESLENYGNPYGMHTNERKAWLEELDAPQLQSTDADVLLFVGCTAPHDDYAGKMAGSLVKVLNKAGLSYGILVDEICCGHPALTVGETYVFEDIVEKNTEKFKQNKVRTIVTLSPHCFDTYKNKYPQDAFENIEVMHYTQFLKKLVDEKKIAFTKPIESKVAFHDPCYLGRHNDEYSAPREILKSIPGLELIEFEKNMADSLCCGGGGGRMWVDIETETDRLGKIRAKEANRIGTDVVATSCPWCLIHLVDGVKTEDLVEKITIKDITEIMLEAME